MLASGSELIILEHLLQLVEGAEEIIRESGDGNARGAKHQIVWPPSSPHPCCLDVELDLQRSVQAVLRELSAQAPAVQGHQGKSQQAACCSLCFPHPAHAARSHRQEHRGRGFQRSALPAGDAWSLTDQNDVSAPWLTLPGTKAECVRDLPSQPPAPAPLGNRISSALQAHMTSRNGTSERCFSNTAAP